MATNIVCPKFEIIGGPDLLLFLLALAEPRITDSNSGELVSRRTPFAIDDRDAYATVYVDIESIKRLSQDQGDGAVFQFSGKCRGEIDGILAKSFKDFTEVPDGPLDVEGEYNPEEKEGKLWVVMNAPV